MRLVIYMGRGMSISKYLLLLLTVVGFITNLYGHATYISNSTSNIHVESAQAITKEQLAYDTMMPLEIRSEESRDTYSYEINSTPILPGDITVDGDLNDWVNGNIDPCIHDTQEFALNTNNNVLDISDIYIAHTRDALYLAVTYRADNSLPSNAYISIIMSMVVPEQVVTYMVQKNRPYGNATLGSDIVAFDYEAEYLLFVEDMTAYSLTWEGDSLDLMIQEEISISTGTMANGLYVTEIMISGNLFGYNMIQDKSILLSVISGYLSNDMLNDVDAIPNDIRNIFICYPAFKGVHLIDLGPAFNTVIPDGSYQDWLSVDTSLSHMAIGVDRDKRVSKSLGIETVRICHNMAAINFAINFTIPLEDLNGGFFIAIAKDPAVTEERYYLPFVSTEGNNVTRVRYEMIILWSSLDPRILSIMRHGIYANDWYVDSDMFYISQDIMGVDKNFVELRIPITKDGINAVLGNKIALVFGIFYFDKDENQGDNIQNQHKRILVDILPENIMFNEIIYNLEEIPIESHGYRLEPYIRTISVDGKLDDWDGIDPAWKDTYDFLYWNKDGDGDGNIDIFGTNVDPRAIDLKTIYVSHDTKYLYLGIEMYGNLERYSTSSKVAVEVCMEVGAGAPIFNMTPKPEIIHGSPYAYIGAIRDDQAMVTTFGYGFNVSTVDYWLSQVFDFLVPSNHDSFYYFNGSSAVWYDTTSSEVSTCVSGNVLEMRIPLFDGGFYLHPGNIARFLINTAIWSVPFMYPVDTAPYNHTYGVPLYFEYPVVIEAEEYYYSKCLDYIKDLDLAFSNLLNISFADFSGEYRRYKTIKTEFLTDQGNIISTEAKIEALYNEINAKYWCYLTKYLVRKMAYIYDKDEYYDINVSMMTALTQYNEGRWSDAIQRARATLTMLGNLLPEIKVVIFDSGGTNELMQRGWNAIMGNLSKYTWYNIDVDYTTLNHEGISYSDLSATNAQVIVIDNAYNRANYEILTQDEINAVIKYTEEGHGLIGTGYTLAIDSYPEHVPLAKFFGLNASTQPLAEIRTEGQYIFLDPEDDIFIGMHVDGLNLGVLYTMAPTNIEKGSGARYIAISKRNNSGIIVRHTDELYCYYFTVPVVTKKPPHPLWMPNKDNYIVFFNAIVSSSGIYDVPKQIEFLINLLNSNISDVIDTQQYISRIDEVRALYKAGEFAQSKQLIYSTLRLFLTTLCEVYEQTIDERTEQLYLYAPERYSVVRNEFLNTKRSLNGNLTTQDLYVYLNNLIDLKNNVSYLFETECLILERELTNISQVLNLLAGMGYSVDEIIGTVENAKIMLQKYDLYTAEIEHEKAQNMLHDLYKDVRAKVEGEIILAQGNMFSDTERAERELKRADVFFNRGEYGTAFTALENAKESVVVGYPIYFVVGLITAVVISIFVISLLLTQKRSGVIYVEKIIDDITKKKRHNNVLFVGDEGSSVPNTVLLYASSLRRQDTVRPLIIYDNDSPIDDRFEPTYMIQIHPNKRGKGRYVPERIDITDLPIIISRTFRRGKCNMVVGIFNDHLREVNGSEVQKSAFFEHVFSMARKKRVPLVLYLSNNMLSDRYVSRIVNIASNAYSVEHLGIQTMMYFIKSKRLPDYFMFKRFGTWDRITQLKREGESIERIWYLVGTLREKIKKG